MKTTKTAVTIDVHPDTLELLLDTLKGVHADMYDDDVNGDQLQARMAFACGLARPLVDSVSAALRSKDTSEPNKEV